MSVSVEHFSLVEGRFHPLSSRVAWLAPIVRPPARRALLATAATWGVLCALALAEGVATGTAVRIPLLEDLAASARYLIALPLLILAEPFVEKGLKPAVGHLRAHLVEAEDLPRFDALLSRLERLRDGVAPNVLLLLLAIAPVVGGEGLPWVREATSWIDRRDAGGRTLAGWWHVHVASAVFRFYGYRWLYRLSLWTMFLHGLGRVRLSLVATHPDRAAGLGVLGHTQARFAVIFCATSALIAASLGNAVVHAGVPVTQFKVLIGAAVLISAALVLGPLFLLTGRLLRLKHEARIRYGALAHTYTASFERKWVDGRPTEPLLGTADIQALADLGGGYDLMRAMRPWPISREALLAAVLLPGLPFVPLLLADIPAEEILKRLLLLIA